TMHLTAHPRTLVQHALRILAMGVVLLLVLPAARADQNVAQSPVIGKTTLAEARELWAAGDARIVSEGHLAIGGGSLTMDGERKLGLEQVLLVTVDGVDFETLPVARYAFVDQVLYAVSAPTHNMFAKVKSPFKDLSPEELAQLEQSLTRKYGKPRGLKDMGAGRKPNIFVWDLRENELVLSEGIMSGLVLTLKNKALAKKVDGYAKIECKKHPRSDKLATSNNEVCL
ncbi:MAG: hypothetical protein ACJ8GW_02530, partial [Massilia sp.]